MIAVEIKDGEIRSFGLRGLAKRVGWKHNFMVLHNWDQSELKRRE